MQRSFPSSSESFLDESPSRRKGSIRGRKPPSRDCRMVTQYPYGLPDPSNKLEVRYAVLDAAKVTARALVAADDLIVRIFDDPRHRLHVSSCLKTTHELTRSGYSHFKGSFRSAFRKTVDLERTAETFTQRMQDQGLVEKDEESALAFSNLCVRYAQLKYHTARVVISQVVLNDKIQSRILATSNIPKGTLILELGGLMSSDAVVSEGLSQASSKKRKREDPQYNMFSVIWKGSDRLLLGPARFINHSCQPNSKLKPFPKSNAWGIESSKDILAGEELTVHYGKWYFLPGECACATCRVSLAEPLALFPNPYPTPPAEVIMDWSRPRKRARVRS